MRSAMAVSVMAWLLAVCLFAFRLVRRQRNRNRFPARTVTKQVRARTGTSSGQWGGERTRLQERGVTFDFQYVSDSLWDLKSVQPERFASWNRFRGTVDIDFGKLTGWHDLYFHATALWQGGGNLGDISRTY